jgi:hypothetical protein
MQTLRNKGRKPQGAKMKNYWLTADIRIETDSAGAMTATHRHAGVLVESTFYASRKECRREAVEYLKAMKLNYQHRNI